MFVTPALFEGAGSNEEAQAFISGQRKVLSPTETERLDPDPTDRGGFDTSRDGTVEIDGEPAEGPRYRVEGPLGEGAFGRVEQVFDNKLQRTVARKTAPRAKRSLLSEARILAALDHPNIPPIYELESDGGQPRFTMKLADSGVNLREVIDGIASGDRAVLETYDYDRRARILWQVAQALAAAHKAGVCHGDIKPENIVVEPDGGVLLVDWGAAADPSHTGVLGTPAYCSPERLERPRKAAPEPADDLYALAAVGYELLTGSFYVREGPVKDRERMRERIGANTVRPAKYSGDEVHGTVPPAHSHVVGQGLALDPSARFQNAEELVERWLMVLERRPPVLCPRTGLQRAMYDVSRFLDRNRVLGPVVFGLALAGIVTSMVLAIVFLISD